MDEKKAIAKWGFGMAPISTRMQARYDDAVQTGLDVLDSNLLHEEVNLDHLSDLKGMFNRCLRQDQWDWFSVFTDFGEPRHEDLKLLGHRVGLIRQAVQARDDSALQQAKAGFVTSNGLSHLLVWQNGIDRPGSEEGGWIYILSTRGQPGVLKIGMTTRNVAQRVKEINSATGVLIPYAARKVFRVKIAAQAERELFQLLAPYRLRPDREFFQLPFGIAVGIVEQYLETSRMRDRKQGTVLWFDSERQYGFIQGSGPENIFLHVSQIDLNDARLLRAGVRIEFDISDRPQGRCALSARVLDTAGTSQ